MPQHPFTIDNLPAPQVRAQINLALQALASVSSGETQPPVTFAGMFWLDTSPATPVLRVRNAANNGWIEVGELTAAGMNIGGRVPQVVSATAPASPTPGMQWVDTSQSPPVVKVRNGGNTGWITIASLPDVLLRDGSLPMTGRLDLAAGSSGGLGFAGDTGTGLVRDAANTLRLRTNGSNRMTLTNAGVEAHVPLTVPAATAPGHAVRLDQLPAVLVRQFVTATYAVNATTTNTVFVSTGATISITPTSVPCRLLVYALIPAPLWTKTFVYSGGGGGGGGGEGGSSAEFRFTSSLGNGVPSRISGTFYVPPQTITVGNYQAITVRDFRAVSSSGTYIFTLQMRVTGSDEQVSTRANEAAIMLEAWELAP